MDKEERNMMNEIKSELKQIECAIKNRKLEKKVMSESLSVLFEFSHTVYECINELQARVKKIEEGL